jgi:hypothetical protein
MKECFHFSLVAVRCAFPDLASCFRQYRCAVHLFGVIITTLVVSFLVFDALLIHSFRCTAVSLIASVHLLVSLKAQPQADK